MPTGMRAHPPPGPPPLRRRRAPAQVVNLLQEDNVTTSLVYPMLGILLDQLSSHKPVSLHDWRKDVDFYTIDAKNMEPHMSQTRETLRGQISQRFVTDIQATDYIKISIATVLDIRYVCHWFESVHM
jgi:hypothetical protein